VRKIRERHEAGAGDIGRVRRAAYQAAAKAAFGGEPVPTPWEQRTAERQAQVRALYLAQAQLLARSADVEDRALAAKVVAFVSAMPQPDSQRLALARELRAVTRPVSRDPGPERRR
jgi:hypothetical protein